MKNSNITTLIASHYKVSPYTYPDIRHIISGNVYPELNEKIYKSYSRESLLEEVAQYSEGDPLSKDRKVINVEARRIACYILRNRHGFTFKNIAYELGLKEHSAAWHNFNKVLDIAKLYADSPERRLIQDCPLLQDLPIKNFKVEIK